MMNSKPLAVIGQITELAPIEGADRIQKAVVICGSAGKWTGVAGKDLQVGQLVTVFLQDAVLPPAKRWAFMEARNWRVRMARFKGVPSECLIVPGVSHDAKVGDDLTEALGVTKYTKPVPATMRGEMMGAFPDFIPKTDEPNFQTVPELVARMGLDDWYATEKVDGTSCTAWVDGHGLHVCSRNWELREFTASGTGNIYWQTARKYNLEKLPEGMALQFEVVGPGIQGNPMGLTEVEGRAFSLYHIGDQRYTDYTQLAAVASYVWMPIARHVQGAVKRPHSDDELREMAAIRYPNGKHGEGVVIRACDSSWSFKVINLNYKD